MSKTIIGAGIVGATMLAAAPAQAQLAPSGPRIELQVGHETDSLEIAGESDNDSGAYVGVAAGYDISLIALSLGIDVEAGESSVSEDFFFVEDGADVFGTLESDRELYVGGRITVPVGPLFDVYAKAGYSNVRTLLDITTDDGTDIVTDFIEDTDDGYRIGGGARYYLKGGTYLGGEYRYADYGDGLSKQQIVGTLGIRF